jgi:hypothetical protein
MANELSYQVTFASSKGDAIQVSWSKVADVTGTESAKVNVLVATAAAALNLAGLGSCQCLAFKNTDPTNFVVLSYAADGSTPFAQVDPGCCALFRPTSTTLYAKADTQACQCSYCAVEV